VLWPFVVFDDDEPLLVDVGPPAVEEGEFALMHEASLDAPMGTMSDEPPERPCASVTIRMIWVPALMFAVHS
jgi:hypothetical protein